MKPQLQFSLSLAFKFSISVIHYTQILSNCMTNTVSLFTFIAFCLLFLSVCLLFQIKNTLEKRTAFLSSFCIVSEQEIFSWKKLLCTIVLSPSLLLYIACTLQWLVRLLQCLQIKWCGGMFISQINFIINVHRCQYEMEVRVLFVWNITALKKFIRFLYFGRLSVFCKTKHLQYFIWKQQNVQIISKL